MLKRQWIVALVLLALVQSGEAKEIICTSKPTVRTPPRMPLQLEDLTYTAYRWEGELAAVVRNNSSQTVTAMVLLVRLTDSAGKLVDVMAFHTEYGPQFHVKLNERWVHRHNGERGRPIPQATSVRQFATSEISTEVCPATAEITSVELFANTEPIYLHAGAWETTPRVLDMPNVVVQGEPILPIAFRLQIDKDGRARAKGPLDVPPWLLEAVTHWRFIPMMTEQGPKDSEWNIVLSRAAWIAEPKDTPENDTAFQSPFLTYQVVRMQQENAFAFFSGNGPADPKGFMAVP